MRAYRVRDQSAMIGKTVTEIERMVSRSAYSSSASGVTGKCSRLHRTFVCVAGDVAVLSGRREVLVDLAAKSAIEEVEDREALDVPAASLDVFVTSKDVVGKTVAELAQSTDAVRSVFLRSIRRRGRQIPLGPGTTIERADVVRLTGPETALARVVARVGEVVEPSDRTDFVALALGIFTGALIGIAIVIPLGTMNIVLGTSVGTLLAGLVTGYLHSVRPLFGRIPDPAIALMSSLGLAAFVAMIGLSAGPHFIEGLREAGVGLFFGGIVVTLAPLITGLYFGRYVLRLNPLLVLGGLAGAQTMTARLAAVQERWAAWSRYSGIPGPWRSATFF